MDEYREQSGTQVVAIGLGVVIVLLIITSLLVFLRRGTNDVAELGREKKDHADGALNDVRAIQEVPITVKTIAEHPEAYDGGVYCLEGFFLRSSGRSVIGPDFRLDDDTMEKIINEPHVWANITPEDYNTVDCTGEGSAETCFGDITVCGTIEYAAPGETGFGERGEYRYQITPEGKETP